MVSITNWPCPTATDGDTCTFLGIVYTVVFFIFFPPPHLAQLLSKAQTCAVYFSTTQKVLVHALRNFLFFFFFKEIEGTAFEAAVD